MNRRFGTYSCDTIISYSKYRELEVESSLNNIGFVPLDILVTGITGAGKSTTLNTLFQKKVAVEGDGVDPQTMVIDHYTLSDKRIRFWDTPGLGDGIEADKIHSTKIKNFLTKFYGPKDNYGYIDMVLVILDGGSRDLGTTYKLLNEVIVPHISPDRILVAINQCDMALKGKGWDFDNNIPSDDLLKQLEDKSISVVNRIEEATGFRIQKPVYYSAKYDYNIYKLLDLIIDH